MRRGTLARPRKAKTTGNSSARFPLRGIFDSFQSFDGVMGRPRRPWNRKLREDLAALPLMTVTSGRAVLSRGRLTIARTGNKPTRPFQKPPNNRARQ
jgi:hypothetical protein